MDLCVWVVEDELDGRPHVHFLMTRQELAPAISPSGRGVATLWRCGFPRVLRFDLSRSKRGVGYVFKKLGPYTDFDLLSMPGSRNAEKLRASRSDTLLGQEVQEDVHFRHRPKSTGIQGGRRKCLSEELRRNLLTAYGRGEGTLAALAAKFGVSLGVAKKIRQQLIRTGKMERPLQHRGPRKLSPALKNTLREWIEAQPTMTVAELQRKIEQSFEVRVCRSHLYRVRRAMKPRASL